MSSPFSSQTAREDFTQADTQVAKGMAICFLLFFHLFYQRPDIGPRLFGVAVVHWAAQVANICVPIFLILSGYGLTESARKHYPGVFGFYRRRFARIYIDYWCIWILFVPIGILVFSRGLTEVYGQDVWARLLTNMLGLQLFFAFQGYNATWWFMSLILALYLLFPLLKRLSDRTPLGCLALCALGPVVNMFRSGASPGLFELPLPSAVQVVLPWLLPFGLGIYMSQIDGLAKAKCLLHDRRRTKLALYVTILLAIVALRQLNPLIAGQGLLGWAFALIIILIGTEVLSGPRWLRWIMECLGKHSYNIFMFHTFIYFYYFPELTYSFGNPALIFLFLLSVSLLLSVSIEQLKDVLGVNALQRKLRGTASQVSRGA